MALRMLPNLPCNHVWIFDRTIWRQYGRNTGVRSSKKFLPIILTFSCENPSKPRAEFRPEGFIKLFLEIRILIKG